MLYNNNANKKTLTAGQKVVIIQVAVDNVSVVSLPYRNDKDIKVHKEVQQMVTNRYEVAFVYSVKENEEAVKALNDKFQAIIAENGTVENVDDWGKRKLAYPINYETDGYYVFTIFTSATDFPAELERVAGITDGVLRVMITKK